MFRQLLSALVTVAALVLAPSAWAIHVPTSLDVPGTRPSEPSEGYLEFINPTEHPALLGTLLGATPPGMGAREGERGREDIEVSLYCVITPIRRIPELTQLDSAKSMIRNLPPK